MLAVCTAAAIGLLIGPPLATPIMPAAAPMADVRPASSTLIADLLDDFGVQQDEQNKAILARKAALKQRIQDAEAQAAAEAEKAEKLQAERKAKAEAAAAVREAKKQADAAAAAQRRAEREAKEAVVAVKAGGSATNSRKEYGEVVRVNKQAERIAEREARGERAPSLFPQF
uniref:Uncharacterized protein n=1 Tax=Favella ehrenbergii TaxID=182087 RepID=A0A7S3I1M8_9SPIT